MKIRLFILSLLMLISSANVFAQNTSAVENFFRTEDKFYVVVAVLTIILSGILIYIIRLDGKISKIEKNLDK